MDKQPYDYGMIGLGTMGRNLVYNMCSHGYSVAGLDKDNAKLEALKKEKGNFRIFETADIKELALVLKQPRVVLLLVPAGKIVDSVIDELKPFLAENDIIMDCGNSHFLDTDQRIERLAKENIHFMGVGISGGESGARFGPSIMPGGNEKDWERVAEMLKAVSAKVHDEPCVSYLGTGSAGHYVKMVHNGIEYSLMQLIAEAYHLIKELTKADNEELHDIFSGWNNGQLQSFLISAAADIFIQKDDLTKNYLLDMILDRAHQKGTGKWASQNAMDLQVPVPAIDAAVAARDISAYKNERNTASLKFKRPKINAIKDKKEFISSLGQALYFSMITTFAQGMSLLQHASTSYKYGLRLDEVAKIWRGGCIIRASLLEPIREAFVKQPDLPNLMINDAMAAALLHTQDAIRKTIILAATSGIPVPALMASLTYFDSYHRGWLPANLIQAQRDYFGAHTYERIDRVGNFHFPWISK